MNYKLKRFTKNIREAIKQSAIEPSEAALILDMLAKEQRDQFLDENESELADDDEDEEDD